MAQDAPEFSDGNMAFRKALNSVVNYAKRHGVNPAGVSGWSETADGWMPPRSRGGGEVDLPWDIETDPESEADPKEKRLVRPYVSRRVGAIPESVPISGNSFDPAADRWLVARIDDLEEIAIEIKLVTDSELDGKIYHFTGSPPAFLRADIPLWRFYDEDGEGRVKIMPDVWGEKMVSSGSLRMVFPLVGVPDTVQVRSVPDLI
jgi:hypothetical protein